MTRAQKALARPGRYMLLTHGEGYSLDDGTAIRRKEAETLIGVDLFANAGVEIATQTKTGPVLEPSGDGLFPGFSQTWKSAD